MSYPKTVKDVVAISNANKRQIEALLNQLTTDLMNAPSTEQNWAIRDHLSHLATWNQWMLTILHKEKAWESLNVPAELIEPEERSFDPINAVIYHRYKHYTFEEAYDYWQASHAALIKMLKTFPDDELHKLYADYQPHEAHRPSAQYSLYAYLNGAFYHHYMEHLPWMQATAQVKTAPLITVNHIAVVVEDIANALPFWRDGLGLSVGEIKEVPSENVQIAFLEVEASHIELVQPITPDSGIAHYLAKKGAGIHHICLEVVDIRHMLASLKQQGVQLIHEEPKERDGRQYAFIHPKSAGGVLVELYERL